MLIYLSVFLISIFFFRLAEKNKTNKYNKIFSFLGILIPSILAGGRASSVGTDVRVYGQRFYTYAYLSDSFTDLVRYMTSIGENADIGFHFLNFIISRVFEDYHFGLFFYSIIVITCFYLANVNFSELHGGSVAFRMLLFYFILFNTFLNMIRQSIAIALCFLAISFLIKNNNKAFVILSILAVLFHNSGIIVVAVYFCFCLYKNKNNNSSSNYAKQFLSMLLFIVGLLIIMLFMKQIVIMFVNLSILSNRYLNYFNNSNSQLVLSIVLLPLMFVLIDVILFKQLNKKNENALFFLSMVIVTFLTCVSNVMPINFTRLSYYLLPLMYETQVICGKCFNNKSRKIWLMFIIFVSMCYWAYNSMYMNYGQTLPYIWGDE